MKTVAVTGASGFVGGQVARYLAECGYKVLAFGRRPVASLPDDISYTSWDITQGNLPISQPVDTVIHCAGSVSDWGFYADMYRTNVLGTRNVLQTFQQAGQFIHISSASVYDPFKPKILVKEDAPYPTRYLNEYASTKQQAEWVVRNNPQPNRVIVRPHIIYGPGDTTILPRLLKARKLDHFLVVGNGTNELSLTYIYNLCYALELIMQRITGFEIFNIADSRTATLNQLITTVSKAYNLPDKTWHVNKRLAAWAGSSLQAAYHRLGITTPPAVTPYIVAQMASHYTLDLTKAREKLGYTSPYDYTQAAFFIGS